MIFFTPIEKMQRFEQTRLSRSPIYINHLAKAFDTVNHEQLLEELQNLSFRGSARNILKNYLIKREQYVNIKNVLSDKLVVRCVPSYKFHTPTEMTSSFEDDTIILNEDDNWSNLKRKAEDDLIKRYLSVLVRNFF